MTPLLLLQVEKPLEIAVVHVLRLPTLKKIHILVQVEKI